MADLVTSAPKRATDLKDRDLSWYAQRLERGRKEIFSEVVTITPDIARHILDTNKDNRPISHRLINGLVHDIQSRNWDLNGEAIVISKDGLLNDGQHRLMAIIEAGEPVQSVMVFGVSRDSRMTVDMGKARTTSNYLSMQSRAHATFAATVAGQWLGFTLGIYGKVSKTKEVTKRDVIKFYNARQIKIDAAIREYGARSKRLAGNALVTAYLIIWEVDAVHADGFFHMLLSGANLDGDDPILWLRSRFTSDNKLSSAERIEIILRYWNAWKEGRKLTRHLSIMGEYPQVKG